jgi:hypothetical protein
MLFEPWKTSRLVLGSARCSWLGVSLSAWAWSAGCSYRAFPVVDRDFAAGVRTPTRIAILPPDSWVTVEGMTLSMPDLVKLNRTISFKMRQMLGDELRRRGYDVDLRALWEGIQNQDESMSVSAEEMSRFARAIMDYGASPEAHEHGMMSKTSTIWPELTAKIGRGTAADAIMMVGMEGIASEGGDDSDAIAGAILVILLIGIIVLAVASANSHGHSGSFGGTGGGTHHASGPSPHAALDLIAHAGNLVGNVAYLAQSTPSTGRACLPTDVSPCAYEPGMAPNPIPQQKNIRVAMTLVSSRDGKVLWHLADEIQLLATDMTKLSRFIAACMDSVPTRAPRTASASH